MIDAISSSDFFHVGHMGFFLLVLAQIIILFFCEEFENGMGALGSFILFVLGLQFLSDVNIFALLWENRLYSVLFLVGYLILSVCWGVYRWQLYVKKNFELLKTIYVEFLNENKLPPETKLANIQEDPSLNRSWDRKLEQNRRIIGGFGAFETKKYECISESPKARNHKSRVIRWMSLWPFGLLKYMLGKYVFGIFDTIYKSISGYLQSISDKIYAKSPLQ